MQLEWEGGFAFDLAFTSVIKPAIRAVWIVPDELDQIGLPVRHS